MNSQQIFYYDASSLYLIVYVFDPYAVGFTKHLIITADDIRNGSFFGAAKVDVILPKNSYVPLSPDNSEGKLLFHVNPMYHKNVSSLE